MRTSYQSSPSKKVPGCEVTFENGDSVYIPDDPKYGLSVIAVKICAAMHLQNFYPHVTLTSSPTDLRVPGSRVEPLDDNIPPPPKVYAFVLEGPAFEDAITFFTADKLYEVTAMHVLFEDVAGLRRISRKRPAKLRAAMQLAMLSGTVNVLLGWFQRVRECPFVALERHVWDVAVIDNAVRTCLRCCSSLVDAVVLDKGYPLFVQAVRLQLWSTVDGALSIIGKNSAASRYGGYVATLAGLEAWDPRHANITRALVAAAADVNARDDDGATALASAIARNAPQSVIGALLAARADVNMASLAGDLPLLVAIRTCGREWDSDSSGGMVRALLQAQADANAHRGGGVVPLIAVVLAGDCTLVADLCAAQADVNGTDSQQRTPLLFAAEREMSDMVQALLLAKADVRKVDINGDNVFSLAISKDKPTSFTSKHAAGEIATLQNNNVGRVIRTVIQSRGDVNSSFSNAAQNDRLTLVSSLLRAEAHARKEDPQGPAPILIRLDHATTDFHAVARLLVRNRPSRRISLDTPESATSLLWAAMTAPRCVSSVRALLSATVDANSPSVDGTSPLAAAIGAEDGALVEILLAAHADANSMSDAFGRKVTPLWVAAQGDMLGVVRALLEHRANVLHVDDFGKTALTNALHKNCTAQEDTTGSATEMGILPHKDQYYERAIDTVIQMCGDVNMSLAQAIQYHRAVLVTYLLRANAKQEALKEEQDEEQEALGEEKRKQEKEEQEGKEEQKQAAGEANEAEEESGEEADEEQDEEEQEESVSSLDEEAISLVREHFAPHGSRTGEGASALAMTPLLLFALQRNKRDLVRALLDAHADVNYREGDSAEYNSLLIGAIRREDSALVRTLFDARADVNARGSKMRSPLGWAIRADCESLTRILLDQQADVNAIDNLGASASAVKTALAGACDMKNHTRRDDNLTITPTQRFEEHQQFLSLRAELDVGSSPLHIAVRSGSKQVVRDLLLARANVNGKGLIQRTSLSVAVAFRKKEFVQMLISAQADVNATDNDLRTPLHGAYRTGCRETIGMLVARGADETAVDNKGCTPQQVEEQAEDVF